MQLEREAEESRRKFKLGGPGGRAVLPGGEGIPRDDTQGARLPDSD